MILEYALKADDFIQYQLFVASKSDRIRKGRIRAWVLASLICPFLAGVIYQSGNAMLAYSLIAAGVLTVFFFPFYQRQQYSNHYRKFVTENYQNRFDQKNRIVFTADHIESVDSMGDGRVLLSALSEIWETGEYFFVGMRTGGAIIIPKSGIPDVDLLKLELEKLAARLKIQYRVELNWKWK